MSEESNNAKTSAERSMVDDNKKLAEDAGAVGDHSALPQDVKEANMKTTTLVAEAIFNRIGPIVTGDLKHGAPAGLAPIDHGFMVNHEWEEICQ